MNKTELQAELKRKGYTYNTFAQVLGISENAFWRKINGYNDFTLPEIQTIVSRLSLDEKQLKNIFFS